MKRFIAFISTFSFVGMIGRNPAVAAGIMTLLGVGGAAGIAMLSTPTITPFVSANFNPSQPGGSTSNLLKPNGGNAGPFTMPAGNSVTGFSGSFAVYGEATVNPNLGYSNGGTESPFNGMTLLDNSSPGLPMFIYQRTANGAFPGSNWWQLPHVGATTPQNATAGSNYAGGFFPFAASGGGCSREPTGVWFGSSIQIVDPGFGCQTAPIFSAATVPNAGAQQTGITATCAAGATGFLNITTSLTVSPGLSPGLTYPVNFTTTGGTPTNLLTSATLTAVSLTGSGPYSLVGTIAGTVCPSSIATGTVNSGASGAYTFPALSASNPFSLGGTGIATKNGQHICFMIGEYGDDAPASVVNGTQFISMVDDKGNALAGSPALDLIPNMGTTSFTGATTSTSATMNVTAMTSFPITSAAYSGGQVVFTMPATTGNTAFVSGSQFTASGLTSTSGNVNITYAVMTITGTGPYTITGNPLTGPGGTPATLANPGTISGSGSVVGTIFPGMIVLGSTSAGSIAPANSVILPYGTASTTGTGGIGTYQLNATQTSSISGLIFAYDAFYNPAAVNSNAAGGATSIVAPGARAGDFLVTIGGTSLLLAPQHNGWGGSLGNFAMLQGAIPNQSGGAPSTSDLASICTKTTDIQAYAKAKSLTVKSLYRMNDLGIFGDSGNATVTGYITNPGGAAATLNIVSTPYGSLALGTGTLTAKLTGVGLPVASPVTIGLSTTCSPGTAPLCVGATYPITPNTTAVLGSSGSPVTLAVGAFAPALPLQSNTLKGYIDTTTGVSTLHVTSLDDGTAHSGFASGTGTLGTSFTAKIDNGSGSAGNTLTVTLPVATVPANAYIGIGTQVCPPVGSSAFTCANVTALGTGVGYNGTYTVDGSAQLVTSQVMYGAGVLPGPATTLQWTASVGTPVAGMPISDGGASITGAPLLITGVAGSTPNFILTIAGNYYGPISADATMQASLTTLVPGEYLLNSAITNPVKVVPDPSNGNGLSGTYKLSGSPNTAGTVGTSGSPVVITGTTITDGGAIVPGPALTIRDQGPSAIFPLTSISAKTGTIALSGDYDTVTLGGTPSGIQVLVSNSANGPPLAGCTPCNWGSLSGTIAAGKWSGTLAGIPGGGPYSVSVRAANGIGYATLPNSIKVGWVFALWGQGQAATTSSSQSGYYTSFFSGLWGEGLWSSIYSGNESFLQGPPIAGNFVPGQPSTYGGDRFGIGTAAGVPLSEAFLAFEQELTNVYGVPATFLSPTHDGVGVGLFALGNVTQTQTVDAGDGSTLAFCSSTKFCASAGVSPGAQLVFNAGSLTGAWFSGASISGTTFTAGTRIGGALEPGMVLNTPNSPVLVMCLTGCSSQMSFGSSTWLLSTNLDSGATPTRADPVGSLLPFSVSSTPMPTENIQQAGTTAYNFGGFGTFLVKVGTFKISVNGTVVCQDSNVFAYNQTGGNCTGATIASSFVNYQTGDYQVTFTSGNAPASSAPVIATWTNIVTTTNATTALSRGQGIDIFGESTAQSGAVSNMFSKTPGGVNGQIISGWGTDHAYMQNSLSPSLNGYQYAAGGYSQIMSFLFGTKFPALIPGASPSVSFMATGQWRSDGPAAFGNANDLLDGTYDQWAEDATTKSLFSGAVASSVLTLSADATGPMWEGEILGCVTVGGGCTIGPLSGVYITGLHSGSPAGWGKNTSTYDLAGASGVSSTGALQNPVYYSGPGGALFMGTLNDIIVQSQGLAGTAGRNPHTASGFTGSRRATSRWAALIYGAAAGNPNPASDPQLSRANDSATATPSPGFDYSTAYQASHSATMVSSSATITVTGGISAHDRPFVVGQLLSCTSCTSGRVILALDVPPTQSTATGAGEVGQTFHITASGTMGTSVTETLSATCSPIGGTGGSNCINIDVAINVSGTFGTAAAIATCGANNINGNAPNYVVAGGKCQDNGIGEITRAFRIGTTQAMFGPGGLASVVAGSVWDDGADMANGAFNQSAAFTCNIVAAKVVQCVKGPAYSSGVFSSVGKWTAGSTYIAYGGPDLDDSTRIASLLGYVGGQPFPITTAGSGYGNGTFVVAGNCGTPATGGQQALFDETISGGALVNVFPSSETAIPAVGLGLPSGCTVPVGFTGTASVAPGTGQGGGQNGAPSGQGLVTIATSTGNVLPGETVVIGGTPFVLTGYATISGIVQANKYVTASSTTVGTTAFTVGPTGGSGAVIATTPLAPTEGVGGVTTYASDSNVMGMFLYDNSGFPGNPLNQFFTNGGIGSGYFEPGLPLRPFGMFMGAAVSG